MEITIRKPFDAHVHLRDSEILERVIGYTDRQYRHAVVMPNTPVVETVEDARRYCSQILNACNSNGARCNYLMTIKLTHKTNPMTIEDMARHFYPAIAKLYPEGVTTASHDGIRDVKKIRPVLNALEHVGGVLCIHAEKPGAFITNREREYLPEVEWIVKNFPGLRVVLEHISTKEAVQFVAQSSVNVGATITAHHLLGTLDMVLGDGLRPHNFCYPVLNSPDDLRAIRAAAFGFEPGCFFFGSDSAPHVRYNKETARGAAGVFTSPCALPLMFEFFGSQLGSLMVGPHLDRLEAFMSRNGAEFYHLAPWTQTITLRNEPWSIPDLIGDIVPFKAGETVKWRVCDDAGERP